MPLFQLGDFTLSSGKKSKWRIDCDALPWRNWECLALIASEILSPFGVVEGVPRGGLLFAEALERFVTPGSTTLLLVEDVVTTGGSAERFRNGRPAIGVAVFCRGNCPEWITPLFRMSRKP